MSTPQLVRVCLEWHRAHGVPFMEAWTRALQSIPRGPNDTVRRDRAEWVRWLKWSRPAWEAAYSGSWLDELLEGAEPDPSPAEDPRLALAS